MICSSTLTSKLGRNTTSFAKITLHILCLASAQTKPYDYKLVLKSPTTHSIPPPTLQVGLYHLKKHTSRCYLLNVFHKYFQN